MNMTVPVLIGQKKEQTQRFLQNGVRVPVSTVFVGGNRVIRHLTKEKHGYDAIQLGFGTRRNTRKAQKGYVKEAKLTTFPLLFREVKLKESSEQLPGVGERLLGDAVFKPGDIVDVTGTSKGKGYAGVVKRHHFKGGPRTHGQSDRERAPGAIGQTTTPGRVYRGKRMAGKMGNEQVTVKNLQVVGVMGDTLFIKGLIPGIINSVVEIKKVGEGENFLGLLLTEEEQQVSNTKQKESSKEPEEEINA